MADLVSLSEEDLAEVMRIERLPGYDAFIHSWTAEIHATELTSADARYFGYRAGAALAGFTILRSSASPPFGYVASRWIHLAPALEQRCCATLLIGSSRPATPKPSTFTFGRAIAGPDTSMDGKDSSRAAAMICWA